MVNWRPAGYSESTYWVVLLSCRHQTSPVTLNLIQGLPVGLFRRSAVRRSAVILVPPQKRRPHRPPFYSLKLILVTLACLFCVGKCTTVEIYLSITRCLSHSSAVTQGIINNTSFSLSTSPCCTSVVIIRHIPQRNGSHCCRSRITTSFFKELSSLIIDLLILMHNLLPTVPIANRFRATLARAGVEKYLSIAAARPTPRRRF